MHRVGLISRGIHLFTGTILMVLVVLSCGTKKKETEEDQHVRVVIDSTYQTMNPMDLEFDTMELAMIDSGMADLVDAYQSIRAYDLPNTTPPALQFNPLPYGFLIPEPTPKIAWDIPRGLPDIHGGLTWPLCLSPNWHPC